VMSEWTASQRPFSLLIMIITAIIVFCLVPSRLVDQSLSPRLLVCRLSFVVVQNPLWIVFFFLSSTPLFAGTLFLDEKPCLNQFMRTRMPWIGETPQGKGISILPSQIKARSLSLESCVSLNPPLHSASATSRVCMSVCRVVDADNQPVSSSLVSKKLQWSTKG